MKPFKKTEAFEEWQRARLERALEDLYNDYPELIDPALQRAKRQVFLDGRSRCDLLFEFDNLAWVVEIKRGTAGLPALRQLARYLDHFKRRFQIVRGTLIAADFNSSVPKFLSTTRHQIELKRLAIDVPVEIKVCCRCRLARAASITTCPWDMETMTI